MIKSERVTFPGAYGDLLAARLDHHGSEPRAYALFAHCFTCSKDLKAVSRISRALVERGIAVLRFDFTGLGESEGDFADSNFSSNLEDLLAAADYLRRNHRAPELLVGHSLGGAAMLVAASKVPESVAVATLGAPSDTLHLRDTLLRSAPELEDQAEAEVVLAGRKFRIRRQLLEDLDRQKVLTAVRELGRALLVCHSPVDEVVDVDHARRIYEAARHPRSYVSLDQADHLLIRDPEDARWVAEMLAAWSSRYLDASSSRYLDVAAEEPATTAALPHGVVEVGGETVSRSVEKQPGESE
ncbi:MAG: alpha/beta fold hydrolase [Thermoanaerobaculia bacterium]